LLYGRSEKKPNKINSELAQEPSNDFEKATDFSIDNEEEMLQY